MAADTTIVLIRHAETDWNAEKRFQGHADTPLNKLGQTRIEPVIEALRTWEPEVIFTSDLIRAREMAEEAGAALGIEVIGREDLRECSYGEWEGKTLQEVRRAYGDDLEAWRRNEANLPRGGGESLIDMQTRAVAAIESIAEGHAGRTIALFSHSGPIRGMICSIFDLPIEERYRFEINNASLNVIRRQGDGGWQVLLLNETSHLGLKPGMVSPVASRE
jgi:broad specificity phosphatase PhoE